LRADAPNPNKDAFRGYPEAHLLASAVFPNQPGRPFIPRPRAQRAGLPRAIMARLQQTGAGGIARPHGERLPHEARMTLNGTPSPERALWSWLKRWAPRIFTRTSGRETITSGGGRNLGRGFSRRKFRRLPAPGWPAQSLEYFEIPPSGATAAFASGENELHGCNFRGIKDTAEQTGKRRTQAI